jgi:hypothetical protein
MPRINIHDDLTFALPDDDARIMEYINEISQTLVRVRFDWQIVPLKVEWKIGYNWADLHDIHEYTGEYVQDGYRAETRERRMAIETEHTTWRWETRIAKNGKEYLRGDSPTLCASIFRSGHNTRLTSTSFWPPGSDPNKSRRFKGEPLTTFEDARKYMKHPIQMLCTTRLYLVHPLTQTLVPGRRGITRGTRGTNPEWRADAERAAFLVLREYPDFTTDDIKWWMIEWNSPKTRDNRSFGGLMRRLESWKVCAPTKEMRPSIYSPCHRRKKEVWRSLIWDGVTRQRVWD